LPRGTEENHENSVMIADSYQASSNACQ
jgi:hypothetical protein